MIDLIEYKLNRATELEVLSFLLFCDEDFVPPLSTRVDLAVYAKKLTRHAILYESWSGGDLIGLVAMYCNKETNSAFISNVNVKQKFARYGIASELVRRSIEHASSSGMQQVTLQVAISNLKAIKLYEKIGFDFFSESASTMNMSLLIERS